MLATGVDSPTTEDRRGIGVIEFGKVQTIYQAMPTVTAACDLGSEVSAGTEKGAAASHAAAFQRFCMPRRLVNENP
jgi:hypothetical protein